jgi:hypothetical protein
MQYLSGHSDTPSFFFLMSSVATVLVLNLVDEACQAGWPQIFYGVL